MSTPDIPLPSPNDRDWMDWASEVETLTDEVRGRLSEAELRATYRADVAGDIVDPATDIGAAIGSVLQRTTYHDLPTSGIVSAHRGSSRDGRPIAPEGSMSAYRVAAALGADILDVDYRVTSDGVLVAMHDNTVDATTSGTGNVSAYQFHQLPPISMPEAVGTGWAAEGVPTLEEIVSTFGGKVLLTLEAKDGIASVAPLAEIIHRHSLAESIYINTPDWATAQAITDADCLAHVYGLSSTAAIDAAVAAGAKLIEIPYNASSALVAHAQASGVHRFIAGPISNYNELDALTPGIQGYVSDAIGYLNRPGGKAQRSTSSLAPAVASAKRGAGWRLNRPAGGSAGASWLTTSGLVVRDTADPALQYTNFHLGDLSGAPAAAGSISVRLSMPTLPTTISQRLGLRALAPEETGNGLDTNTKGYVMSLRGTGELNLWTSPTGAYGGGTSLGAIAGAALVAGTVYELLFEWTATQVRLTRVDTGGTTGWVTNSDWRDNNIYTVTTMESGRGLIHDVVRTG